MIVHWAIYILYIESYLRLRQCSCFYENMVACNKIYCINQLDFIWHSNETLKAMDRTCENLLNYSTDFKRAYNLCVFK